MIIQELDVPRFDYDKRVYTVNEVMEILDISKSGVYNLVERGLFRCVRAAGCIRISKKSFDAWFGTQDAGVVKDVDPSATNYLNL